jgi:hypothetical protein
MSAKRCHVSSIACWLGSLQNAANREVTQPGLQCQRMAKTLLGHLIVVPRYL